MNKFKKIITVFISFALIFGCMTVSAENKTVQKKSFWDIPKDYWGYNAISALASNGFVNGMSDGSFRPDDCVTRAEWAKMMIETAKINPSNSTDSFSDTKGHWANSYINAAKPYLSAESDGLFHPDSPASREDVTVSMVKIKGFNTANADLSSLNGFSDKDSISESAMNYVAVAVQKGLINGFEDNTFRAKDTLTRAEAATLLSRAFSVAVPVDSAVNKVKTAYSVDTLVRATVPVFNSNYSSTNYYDYTYTLNGDMLIYVNNNNIECIDINTKNNYTILSRHEFNVDTEQYALSDFEITSVCFAKKFRDYRNCLLITGKYETVNSSKRMDNNMLFVYCNGSLSNISSQCPGEVLSVSASGIIYSCGYSKHVGGIDEWTLKTIGSNGYYYTLAVQPTDEPEYILNRYKANDDLVISLNRINLNKSTDDDRNSRIRIGYGISGGLGIDKVYRAYHDDKISITNYFGKELDVITPDNCTPLDNRALQAKEIAPVLKITDSGKIIYYDIQMEAFRVIVPSK